MADNTTYTPGAGATIAADDVGGVLHQRVKLSQGADGVAVDVSPAAPRLCGASTLKVNAAATVVGVPTTGVVEYNWAAGDTDTPGRYDAEFEVTVSGGQIFSTPTVGFLRVNVEESF